MYTSTTYARIMYSYDILILIHSIVMYVKNEEYKIMHIPGTVIYVNNDRNKHTNKPILSHIGKVQQK